MREPDGPQWESSITAVASVNGRGSRAKSEGQGLCCRSSRDASAGSAR
jgi:hypothetical protein